MTLHAKFGYRIHGATYGPFDDAQAAADFGRTLHAKMSEPHFSTQIGMAGEVIPLYDPDGDLFMPFRQFDPLGERAQVANG